MKQGKKSRNWSNLFYNNRFVMVFSFIVACCLWAAIMSNNTDENQTWKIDNVPITVEYSTGAVESGLKVYNLSKSDVSVSIQGNSLTVRQVKAENLEVVATITENMKDATNNTVILSARKKNGVLADFSVASIEPGTITAEVDVAKEATLPIENEISVVVETDCYARQPTLSSETVVISGPQSIVNQIDKVVAKYEMAETLTETKEFSAPLVLYDDAGNVIENSYIQLSPSAVNVRVPVLWRKTIPIVTEFRNKPTAFPDSLITATPVEIEVAGAKESLGTLNNIVLSPIDFSKVNLSNTVFTLEIGLEADFYNISNYETSLIKFDLQGYQERTVTIDTITVVNVKDDREVEVRNDSIDVQIIGPAGDVAKISQANLYAQVNMSKRQDALGTQEVPLTVGIQGNTSCWVSGSYTASVYISEK